MRLLVGLGNPGASYSRNRHNIGFMAIDKIVDCYEASGWRTKFHGKISEALIDQESLLILKPGNFMNLSGQSVSEAAQFYKIPCQDIFVFHDDLDLVPGKIRVKQGGGTGGHNGLKSIDAHLGNDYWRIRLGIGHPGHRDAVTPWVLGNFPQSDETWLMPLLDSLAKKLPVLLAGNIEKFISDREKTYGI